MPDVFYNSPRYSGTKERLVDQGDGSHAAVVATTALLTPVDTYVTSATWQVNRPVGGDYDVVEVFGGNPATRLSYLFRLVVMMTVAESPETNIQVKVERRSTRGTGGVSQGGSPGKYDTKSPDPISDGVYFTTPPTVRGTFVGTLFDKTFVVSKSKALDTVWEPHYPVVLRSAAEILAVRIIASSINPTVTVGIVFGEKGL